MEKTADLMVITAHADDAEFGAAGTVAQWTQAGKRAVYVVCTNGNKGTSNRSLAPEALMSIREQEQHAACDVLGVEEVVFLGHGDQTLEDTPAFRKQLVEQIRIYRPHTIISLDPYRRYLWHRDHRIVGQVVMDAVFPFARDHMAYPDMLEQGLEPHNVKEVHYFGTEDINHWVDIETTFDRKLAALECHASQVHSIGDGDLGGWLRKRCRLMAQGSKFNLAEAYHKVILPD